VYDWDRKDILTMMEDERRKKDDESQRESRKWKSRFTKNRAVSTRV